MPKQYRFQKYKNWFEQEYVKERLKSSLKKFLVDMGILSNNTKFLSHECLMTFCSLTKYHHNPPSIRPYSNPWPFYRTRRFIDLWEVSIECCSMLTGDAYSCGHMVPSHFGLAYVLLVETIRFPELVFYPEYSLRTSLGTFSILLVLMQLHLMLKIFVCDA